MDFKPKKVPHLFILLSEFIAELILDFVEKLSYNQKTSIPTTSKTINLILSLSSCQQYQTSLESFFFFHLSFEHGYKYHAQCFYQHERAAFQSI